MRKTHGITARLLGLLLVPLLLIGLCCSIQAETAQPDTGSLTVSLTDAADGRSKEGVTIAVVQAGTFENGQKVLSTDFAGTGIDLNALENVSQAEEAAALLEAKARELSLPSSATYRQARTDAAGQAVFSDLPAGVYLVYAADIAGFERIIPALISLPSADENGLAVWDVSIEPKHTALPALIIRKVDASKKTPILKKSFVFSGYSDPSCREKISEVKGNQKTGTASFVLTYGTLYIKESQAPKGYALSRQVIKAEYRPDNTLWIDGVQVKPDANNCITIDYINTKKKTSSSGADTAYQSGAAITAAGAILLAAGVSALVLQKRRNR